MVNVNHIRFSYGKTAEPILRDFSFQMEDGQCMALLGIYGAGKSTLL